MINRLDQLEEDGVATVRFTTPESATACVSAFNGRWFAGRQIEASIFDGAKYKKSGKEEGEGEKVRLEEFAKWLEEGSADEDDGGFDEEEGQQVGKKIKVS